MKIHLIRGTDTRKKLNTPDEVNLYPGYAANALVMTIA
jgi:hypothetical protein